MSFGIPTRIDVKYDDKSVRNMLAVLRAAPFPDKSPIDVDTPWNLGIEYDYLKKLKVMFQMGWSWQRLEKKIAKFDNYLVHYEYEGDALDLHFVHAKSPRRDAIPLILLHGWPGTFFDFHKVIGPLTHPANPDLPAFHVVVPSLPGCFISTLPRRDGWNITDTARVYDGLMTSVLGYPKYVGQGGNWGSTILRVMGSIFPESLHLAHFNLFIAASSTEPDLSTYSELEKRLIKPREEMQATGFGYYVTHLTKPFTIGLAIASSPLALLAYIGEKLYTWSDPRFVDPYDILDTVALYYLSESFATSVMIYNQSNKIIFAIRAPATEGNFLLKIKFGYSVFPYDLGGVPKAHVTPYGPLVYHKEHTNGGHFPALDNPSEFVGDLREFFGKQWNPANAHRNTCTTFVVPRARL